MADDRAFRLTPQVVMGLLVMALGVVFTLDNLDLLDAGQVLRYWPAAFVALGAAHLLNGRWFAGFVFTAAGTVLLLQTLGYLWIRWSLLLRLWPLQFVILGLVLIWHAMRRGRAGAAAADSNETVSAFAVLSGVSRANNAKNFRGGELTAVMGGCEIDLRPAAMTDGEAVIDVFAMMGGIELRVPETWSVVSKVVPLLGGFEDNTKPPVGDPRHRLIVRGFAIMGGVEVRN
jgi:predicted membrane protein